MGKGLPTALALRDIKTFLGQWKRKMDQSSKKTTGLSDDAVLSKMLGKEKKTRTTTKGGGR